jgi:hypothetical protein
MAMAIKQLLHLLFRLLPILRRHRKRHCWSCCYPRCEWCWSRGCSSRVCKLGQHYPHSRLYVLLILQILGVLTDKWCNSDCQTYGYTDERETACMDTYNASNLVFTDYTVGNAIDRQWNWMLCNEPFDYWQE